jgi:hypothetical protein
VLSTATFTESTTVESTVVESVVTGSVLSPEPHAAKVKAIAITNIAFFMFIYGFWLKNAYFIHSDDASAIASCILMLEFSFMNFKAQAATSTINPWL